MGKRGPAPLSILAEESGPIRFDHSDCVTSYLPIQKPGIGPSGHQQNFIFNTLSSRSWPGRSASLEEGDVPSTGGVGGSVRMEIGCWGSSPSRVVILTLSQ